MVVVAIVLCGIVREKNCRVDASVLQLETFEGQAVLLKTKNSKQTMNMSEWQAVDFEYIEN